MKTLNERIVLAFEEPHGDGVQFTIRGDSLRVDCHSDWCGDSETGFGAEVGFDMNKQQAAELLRLLKDWIERGEVN